MRITGWCCFLFAQRKCNQIVRADTKVTISFEKAINSPLTIRIISSAKFQTVHCWIILSKLSETVRKTEVHLANSKVKSSRQFLFSSVQPDVWGPSAHFSSNEIWCSAANCCNHPSWDVCLGFKSPAVWALLIPSCQTLHCVVLSLR